MSNLRLSIIIPVYNVEKYVGRCLDSILGQSFSEFEIILVDDGSSDNSLIVLENYASKDKRVRVVSKPNGGVSSARNQGLKLAKGDWIQFIDADDELMPDALEILLSGISDDIDIVVADYVYDPDQGLPEIESITMQRCIDSGEFLFSLPFNRYGGFLWNKLFRRIVIEDNSLTFCEKILYNEDRLFVFEYLTKTSGKRKFINKPVYRYYQNEGGAMTSIKGPNYWKFETDFDAFIEMCRISNEFNSGALTDMIYSGTYNSFIINLKLNKLYGDGDKEYYRRLRLKLVSTLPSRYLLKYKIGHFFDMTKAILIRYAKFFGMK